MWWTLACGGEDVFTLVAEPGSESVPGSVGFVTAVESVGVDGEFVALIDDLGGDGADDLITELEPANRLAIWPLPLGGSPVVLEAPQAVILRAAAAGDLTGDGAPDLWMWDAAGVLVRYLVPGPFDADDADVLARAVATLPSWTPLAPLDANGDGADDYVAHPYVCYGPFPDGIDLEACLRRADPADGAFTSAGDLDGDDRPELAVTMFLTETARTRPSALQVVHGANPLGQPFLEVVGGGDGALADVDGDGALDVAWQRTAVGDQPLDVAFGPWAPGAVLSAGGATLADPVTFLGVVGAEDRRVVLTSGGETWLADLSGLGVTTLAASAFPLLIDGVTGRAIGDLDGDGSDELLLATSRGEYLLVW